jgi:hypothetical protein
MQDAEDIKAYYYFDEAGDPQILARKGVNLVERGVSSKVFMVGYLETKNPKEFSKALIQLREEISKDEYLAGIPSIKNTKRMFHASVDCAEVHERVFKLLKQSDFTFYCVAARKDVDLFRKRFDLKSAKLYEYLVSKLLENRLHLYSEIDCYFSAMGSTVRQDNMEAAIQNAITIFQNKWQKENVNNIRVIIQQSSEIPLLQAADYVLWTIQRVYERHDFRYYNYLKDKIKLVHDVFDFEKYPKTYYTPGFPLEAKRIDPV